MSTAAALFWSRSHRVFDLDGTLVDTLPDLADALDEALADLDLEPVGAEVVRASLHSGLEGSAAAALAVLGAPARHFPQLVERYVRRYAQTNGRRAAVYGGVRPLLEHIARRGERLAVCTNKPEALARELLLRTGLLPYFSAVVGADTCTQRKPHPEPLLQALAQIDGGPTTGVLVGDSQHDVHCAQAAGAACVFHDSGYGRAPVLAPPRFSSFLEILRAGPGA